jgi:hypothetical protein
MKMKAAQSTALCVIFSSVRHVLRPAGNGSILAIDRGANLFPRFIEYLKTNDKADEEKKRAALVEELQVSHGKRMPSIAHV